MTDDRQSPFHVVLVHPEIPQNTGSIARTCAATRTPLHLVEPLGFSLDDRYLKRAGLDYWPSVALQVHPDWAASQRALADRRAIYFSARSDRSYVDAGFQPGDQLVFGCETKGLPREITEGHSEAIFRIPIFSDSVRSLNLSNAVAIVLYEALRQCRLLDERS